MTHPRYPSLYRINTLRQSELAAELGAGRPRWDDIRDQGLDFLTQTGFDPVWFPGVWRTGPAGHKVSLPNPRGYLTHICLFKREGEVTAVMEQLALNQKVIQHTERRNKSWQN